MQSEKKCRIIKKAVVAIAFFTILTGTIVVAKHSDGSLVINGEKIPDLEPLGVVQINETVSMQEGIDRTFSSMDELEDFLDICFLRSPEEADTKDCRIRYQKIGQGYNMIEASAYIIGDATDIAYDIPKHPFLYSWKEGEVYKKPINMKLWFRSDDVQKEIGYEYLGNYSFVEDYVSPQGYKVDILREDIAGLEEAYTPYISIFVADNIRYELRGRVGLEEMKRIVNTLQ